METLRKLQLAQLYMMSELAKICEEEGIRYYLCGGTLLGAIRHGGFIPWDDDLDITMYRSELSKLVSILRKKHSDRFFVQDFESDKNYTRYITKIRLNDTRQVEKGFENDGIHQGIYIDIFPLDHVTKTDGFGLKMRGKLLRLLFAYKSTRCKKDPQATPFKRFLMKVLLPFTYLFPTKFINGMFDWVCTATDIPGAKYTTSFASHYLWKRQLVENDVYGDGVMQRFECFEFRIPSKYETLLLQIFGPKYMELPPVEKRNSGHTLVEIDLGKYESIIDELGSSEKNCDL